MVALSSMVSTGATLPVGQALMLDEVTVGASTGVVEVVRLGAAAAGSTALISTASPLPVLLQDSTATVTIQGNSTALISTTSRIRIESTAALSVTLSTGSTGRVEISGGLSSVTVQGTVAVTDNAGSLTVDMSEGASTVSAVLSTAGMGGSTGNPIHVIWQPRSPTLGSTFASTVLTSTTAWTAFSSAASTRFVITDVEIMNQGGTIVMVSIFDGSTTGTVLDRTYCATAGGGKSAHYVTPIFNTTGNALTVQQDAASTITVNLRGYRSS